VWFRGGEGERESGKENPRKTHPGKERARRHQTVEIAAKFFIKSGEGHFLMVEIVI
jgi:hypothetical protein